MTEKIALELKKGETFRMKGKRKKYLIEDIFVGHLSMTIYYRDTRGDFKRMTLPRSEIVDVF